MADARAGGYGDAAALAASQALAKGGGQAEAFSSAYAVAKQRGLGVDGLYPSNYGYGACEVTGITLFCIECEFGD